LNQSLSREERDDVSDKSITLEKAGVDTNLSDAIKSTYETNLARRLKRKMAVE